MGPYKKDPTIQGIILRSPMFGNPQFTAWELQVLGCRERVATTALHPKLHIGSQRLQYPLSHIRDPTIF